MNLVFLIFLVACKINGANSLQLSDKLVTSLENPNPEIPFEVLVPFIEIEWVAGSKEKGFQEGNAKEARFKLIGDILSLSHKELLIADSLNHRIRKLNEKGQIETLIGDGRDMLKTGMKDFSLSSPIRLLQYAENEILIQSHQLNIVLSYHLQRQDLKLWLASNSHIDLLESLRKIEKLNSDFFEWNNEPIKGIAVQQGQVYICERNRIYTIKESGEKSALLEPPYKNINTDLGSPLAFPQYFLGVPGQNCSNCPVEILPTDLVQDSSDNIYIVDHFFHKIRKFNLLTDSFSTLIGKSYHIDNDQVHGNFVDGSSNKAELNSPEEIFLMNELPTLLIRANDSARLYTKSGLYTLAKDFLPLEQDSQNPNVIWGVNKARNQIYKMTIDTENLLVFLNSKRPILVNEKKDLPL